MTCREFKREAASLRLRELSRPADLKLFVHAEECSQCAAWLDEQRMLAAEMQALQTWTAGREAGPDVERVLLRMYRQEPFKAVPPVAALRSAPAAFRLSRFFEVGAYVAVAAAIVVGLFLGFRLIERRSVTGGVQSQAVPAGTVPLQQATNATVAIDQTAKITPSVDHQTEPLKAKVVVRRPSPGGRASHTSVAVVSQNADGPDYVALMFCDPVICSSDVQVVRMELPAAGSGDQDAQTQVADVVVGYDGLVRAMRIVK